MSFPERHQQVKRRLITGIVALTLAITTTMGMTPPRATASSATNPTAHPHVDVATIAAAVKIAYEAYQAATSGGTSLKAAVSQILAAIQSAQTAIINHIDAIAVANARACAQNAVVDFPNFEVLTPDNQQAFAVAATACVDLINSLVATVTDRSAQDQLGFSVNAVGPIALITRSRAGLSNTSFVPVLRSTNQQISTDLAPSCSFIFDPDFQGKVWACVAYNGNFQEDPNRQKAQNLAATDTSWLVANNVLTQLAGL